MLFRLLAVPSGVGNGFVFIRPHRQQRASLEFVRHTDNSISDIYRGVDYDIFSRNAYRFSDPLGPRPRFPFLPAKPG